MVIKVIGIIKGDIRYKYLSDMINNYIISDKLIELKGIEELLLPMNGINNDYEIKGTTLNLLDIIKQNSIKRIYVGNSSKRLDELCDKYSIELIKFLNGSFILENAKLTAKGIIHYLCNNENDISDYKILVVGYGNISYYLCDLLDVYDVKYAVLTLNETEKKFINLKSIKSEEMISGKGYDIIINTIPDNLDWDYSSLINLRVIDVASSPFGFDIDKIIQNNINYYIFSAIPSKYAPSTAAKILKNALKIN